MKVKLNKSVHYGGYHLVPNEEGLCELPHQLDKPSIRKDMKVRFGNSIEFLDDSGIQFEEPKVEVAETKISDLIVEASNALTESKAKLQSESRIIKSHIRYIKDCQLGLDEAIKLGKEDSITLSQATLNEAWRNVVYYSDEDLEVISDATKYLAEVKSDEEFTSKMKDEIQPYVNTLGECIEGGEVISISSAKNGLVDRVNDCKSRIAVLNSAKSKLDESNQALANTNNLTEESRNELESASAMLSKAIEDEDINSLEGYWSRVQSAWDNAEYL
jgi:exonuclease VII small subunit